jgi:8-oxo-dGTP pyrophosphatase MutT (NUDIX family)
VILLDYPKTAGLPIGAGVAVMPLNMSGLWMNQRLGSTMAGKWQCPGGGGDPQEQPHQTAIRELWEETGLLLHRTELKLIFQDVLPYEDQPGTYRSYCYLAVTRRIPEHREPHKGTPWELIPWARLPGLDLCAAIKSIVSTWQ